MNWHQPTVLFLKLRGLIVALAVLTFTACLNHGHSARRDALEYRQEKKYSQAIDTYYQHIQDRLALQNRPQWENPYIYLLDIGDIYLEQDLPLKALEVYEQAQKNQVDPAYVSDRLRNIGSWYEQQGNLMAAIEHLKKYRHRDEFMFDLMLNRLAKELVTAEEQRLLTETDATLMNQSVSFPSPSATPPEPAALE